MVQTRRCSFSVPSLPSSSPSSRPAKVIGNGMKESARNQRRLQSETPPSMTLNFPPRPPRAPNTNSNSNSNIRNNVVMKPKTSPLIPIVPSQSLNPTNSSPADHFLCGFNLDNCSDLLSIPDPPSPESQRKRNKRRESSPLLRPLQDLTNSGLSESLQKKRSRRSISTLPSPQNVTDLTNEQKRIVSTQVDSDQPRQPMQKRRKSLCRPLSPHLKLHNSDEVTTADTRVMMPPLQTSQVQALEETKNTVNHMKHHNKPIVTKELCLDHLVDIRSKDRKKRHSFVLPNDMFADETNNGDNSAEFKAANEYFRGLMSYKSNKAHSAKNYSEGHVSEHALTFQELFPVADTKAKDNTTKHFQKSKLELEMDEIRRLAREYCLLPTVERDNSSYACDIERLTGYPLIPPTLKRFQTYNASKICDNIDPSESPIKARLDMENRRALLLTMGPVVTRLDQRKHQEVALLEKHTDCKVSKTRNNKYRYVHIPTGQRLDPNEYKYRYLDALGAMKKDIRSSIRHFLHDHGQIMGAKCDEVSATLAAISDSKGNTTKIDRYSPNRLNKIGLEIADRGVEEGQCDDEMDLDESTSPADVRMCKDSSTAIEQRHSKEQPPQKYSAQTTPTNDLILPLPSRDEISSDPQVAAVEIKLWNSIDVALAIYSKEVMAIRSRNVLSRNG